MNYIDISSAYRNRQQWPLASNFKMSFSSSGQNGAATAQDPVALSYPVSSWTGFLFDMANLGFDNVPVFTVAFGGIGNSMDEHGIIFIAAAGALQLEKNYYKHATLRNVANPTILNKISSYEFIGNNRGLFTFETPLAVVPGDQFSILDPTDVSDSSNPFLFVPNGSDHQDDYVGHFLWNETLNQCRTITHYNAYTGVLQLATANNPVVGWNGNHNFSIRQETPNATFIAGPGTTNTLINCIGSPQLSSVDQIYVGWFLRVPNAIYDNSSAAPQGETRRIIAYNGTTKIATVLPSFSASPLGLPMELLPFSYDNDCPFSVKTVAPQETPVTTIRLHKLVLPNVVLKHCGVKTQHLSHVYVELSSQDNPTSTMIYSNNPNANHAMFTATVSEPGDTFIVTRGDKMKQTVRFRLDTALHLVIRLPQGQLFEPIQSDTVSPSKPQSELQIRALFELSPPT